MRRKAAPLLLLYAILLACVCSLTACAGQNRYTFTFLGPFDTSTTIIAYCDNKNEFEKIRELAEKEFTRYHECFDIYNDHEGVNGLKRLNDGAGREKVVLEPEIIELLEFGKSMYYLSGGRLNIMAGALLGIWHEYRDNGIAKPNKAELPNDDVLFEAGRHCDIESLVIDKQAGIAEITDSQARVDVGSIAKGFAVEKLCDTLEARGYTGILINAGGNIRTIGTKPGGEAWQTAVQDPAAADGTENGQAGDGNIAYKRIVGLSLATSGDYQRYYTVNGKRYHHIIDTATRYPAQYVRSVTVCTENAALADAFSTMLFLMPPEDALNFAEKYEDAALEVFIVLLTGETMQTQGW